MPLSNDNPVLVAPRPVRINTLLTRSRMLSAPDHLERVRFSDENSDVEDRRTYDWADKDIPSQRSSPRSPLPSEALEEFLSILRPSFFPPSSPVLLTRRSGAVSLPTFHHERSYSLKGRVLQQKNDLVDESEVSRSTQPSRNAHTPDTLAEVDEFDASTLPVRWFASNILSSPISRMHTRNPFQRHSSNPVSPGPVSPMALSPAAIPLPLPTADELVEIL
ncbi:hypothetical protein FB45DRAFT_831178 [Roridomyces roridus]|uniref:Uncharacterized protein n=1 Tax=Roridomyces roridus TaxID=1738132 RepID=A0AAD7FMB3_9AGAR|nr:hypothetical protein FB45DRAFT_831178 [Roridomyces roridus]